MVSNCQLLSHASVAANRWLPPETAGDMRQCMQLSYSHHYQESIQIQQPPGAGYNVIKPQMCRRVVSWKQIEVLPNS